MTDWKHDLLDLRSRVAYSAMAVAMGLSTLIAGLSHAAYVVEATGTTEALAVTSESTSTPTSSPVVIQTAAIQTAVLPDSTIAAAEPAGLDMSIQHSRIDQWI